MNKAVIYARVSSKDQEIEGYSIPAQTKALQEYAAKKGYIIAKSFTDIETAKKTGRIQFNSMFEYLKSNKNIKHILVEKTDRLLRNIFDYASLENLMNQLDIKIHLVKENAILARDSSSNEKLFFGIRALMAKNYVDNLSEEVRKGMSEKAAQGIYPSWAPYGYANSIINGKKVIIIDPETAPYVKKMFQLYATGSYSLLSLRKTMLADGMIYKNGKNFYTSKLETILNNEFYTGVFLWKGKKYTNASHTPIINNDLFQKVQKMLKNPHKNKSRKELFAYSNLITCGVCGCALTAEIKKGKYTYYRCTGYKGNCKQTYLKEEVLERFFEEQINNLYIPEAAKDIILQGLRESLSDKIEYHNNQVHQIEKQINLLQSRVDEAYRDKIDKKISEEFWQAYTTQWLKEKEELASRLLAFQQADTHYLENANLILELAQKAVSLFKKQEPAQKRRLIDILVSNCSYKDEKIDLELKPIFNEICKTAKTRNWCARQDSNLRPTD